MKTATLAALLITAAGFAAAAPAFADDTTAAPITAGSPVQQAPANGPRTRAEVKAELARARAAGELDNPNIPSYPSQLATGGYTVPRAQIQTAAFFHTSRTAEPAVATATTATTTLN
ncbi:DUF4148 domain-containing protein [Paraburkholderia ferrariae]|uniref:DUF4148 domain-containing protein n=1 Tax=Paraburkholderia ferrariae TaxID=386056 RepID=UPI0007C862C5|nr:DUF4148 domain-containing protein [Paraburkholderia ferrariae]